MARTDRIGDVVLSTPVLTALKQSFHRPFVAMLLQPYAVDVVSGHPDVDQIIIDTRPDGSGFWQLARQIRKLKFDAILVLHPTARLALVGLVAGIPLRLGTGYRLYSVFFNRKIYLHRKKSDGHEVDLNLALVKKLGAHLDSVQFKFHVPEIARQKIASLLTEFAIQPDQPFVVLHPGSGGSAPVWPIQAFAELADQIAEHLHLPVVLTGSEKERDQVQTIWHQTKRKPFSLVGRLNIKELAALLQRCQVLVANSTGPLHLANAVGTQVVGLYCPKRPFFPERWGPYGQADAVITPVLTEACEKSCCMDRISVAQVLEMITRKVLA